jgi:hypothetical protein
MIGGRELDSYGLGQGTVASPITAVINSEELFGS